MPAVSPTPGSDATMAATNTAATLKAWFRRIMAGPFAS
jgi:hypothetical protein